MRISSYNIIQDKYRNINTCLRCYTLEDHHTTSCPKSRDYKICSECSMEGHTWRECDGGSKRCINCEGNHSTMAMGCLKNKEIINIKGRKKRRNNNLHRYNKEKYTYLRHNSNQNTYTRNTHNHHSVHVPCTFREHDKSRFL